MIDNVTQRMEYTISSQQFRNQHIKLIDASIIRSFLIVAIICVSIIKTNISESLYLKCSKLLQPENNILSEPFDTKIKAIFVACVVKPSYR